MLGLTRYIVGGFNDGGDVVRRIAGISRISAVGDPDYVCAGVAEPRNESLDIGDQQVVDAIKAILSGLALALFRQQFAEPHVAISGSVLHVNDQQGCTAGF